MFAVSVCGALFFFNLFAFAVENINYFLTGGFGAFESVGIFHAFCCAIYF